ncbi:MAG: hypothetical protein LBF85_10415 [Tannerella sp.]|jgi:hypothetical protein|nr:hypothetical protein [Tannerella sp.]
MRGLIVALGLWLTIGMYNVSNAQNVSVNVNINLDRQPAWGPSGYHYAAFYYIPAINVYYDVVNELFYYRKAGRWIADYYLPAKYYRYDLYSLYKVVLNDLMHPWIHNKVHRQTYAHFKRIRTQAPIRLMSDHRYHKAKNNTRAWVAPRKSKTDGHQAVRPDKTRNDRKPIVRDSGREKGKNAVKNSQNSRRDKDLSVTRSSERTDKSKTATSENDGRSKRKEKARSSDKRKSDRSDSANHN